MGFVDEIRDTYYFKSTGDGSYSVMPDEIKKPSKQESPANSPIKERATRGRHEQDSHCRE
ncbi:MAG: hypothetical protein LBS77_03500 [Desulfovibrio sp.]|jgi:hypothetical protein|nr:hypothetical protein [Desulfovibrio sp.]